VTLEKWAGVTENNRSGVNYGSIQLKRTASLKGDESAHANKIQKERPANLAAGEDALR
jgi:hypothetical protein